MDVSRLVARRKAAFMWFGIDTIGLTLIDAAFSTTIFLGLAAIVILLNRQPIRRIVVAEVAILASLLILPLVAVAPLPKIEPLNRLLCTGQTSTIGLIQKGTPASPPNLTLDENSNARNHGLREGFVLWMIRAFTLVYLGGVTLSLAWLLLGFWGLRRLLRESDEPDSQTLAIYAQICRELGFLGRPPDLRMSRRISRPIFCETPRPCIILPESLKEVGPDREGMRLVLLHELAHAQSGHASLSIAASLAQSFWFFLPFVRWLRSQLRIDQEYLADRKAMNSYGTSTRYATRLVDFALPERTTAESGVGVESSHPVLVVATAKFDTPLLQRISMLLQCPFRLEPHAPWWWSAILPPILIAAAILLSCIRLPSTMIRSLLVNDRTSSIYVSGTLNIENFVAIPQVVARTGRSISFVLPIVLPREFLITVKVHASEESLPDIRLAGYPLGTPPPRPATSSLQDARPSNPNASDSRHDVWMKRDRSGTTLKVDGRMILTQPDNQDYSEWLTIEPASYRPTVLEHLQVSW